MSKLIKQKQLTPDGADWLTLRLDPYHDFLRPIAGYPDADSSDTIVSVRNYEMNVSKPAAAAANWDAHVFTCPFDSDTFHLGTNTNGNFVQTADTYNLGIVNVSTDDSGGFLFPVAVPVASANFTMEPVASFLGIDSGLSRVIGMGIEIIDTSAALYKQGALTAYRMPASSRTSSDVSYINTAGTQQSQSSSKMIHSPPSKVSEAILYRSSVQWEAKEGCYMVVGQQGIENPFELTSRQHLVITPDTTMSGATANLMSAFTPQTALQAPPILTASVSQYATKPCNVPQQGIFLSGLHNDATFKIRVRVYLERAPLRGETDLIPLSSPSAPYDYKALALYSLLEQQLPIAVPVSFNAKGDWWRWILRTIGKVAPAIGTLLTPVLGSSASLIGSAASTILQTAGAKKRNKKKAITKSNGPGN